MQISTQNTLSLINIIIKSIFPDLAMHMQRTAYISLIIAKELNPDESPNDFGKNH
ncbi:hypothetical protein [Klebsiella pneumoniae complex sp. WS1876_1]|uniref:hypothetical protein n=1 Tax=Klebsiella pneumoniae complex sp. WS1876_1 TaxID=3390279 RepID=UPI003C08FC86